MARARKQHTVQVVFDRARHALHGLPACVFCRKDFTRWGLSDYLHTSRTVGVHSSRRRWSFIPQKRPQVKPRLLQFPLPRPRFCSRPRPPWLRPSQLLQCRCRPPQSSETSLLVTEVLQHLQTGGTAALLRSSCVQRLANYCGLCGQWHVAAFQLDGSARKLAPRLGAAFNPCLYCDESRTHPNTFDTVRISGRPFFLRCTMGFSSAQIDQQMEETFGPHLLSLQYKRPVDSDQSAASREAKTAKGADGTPLQMRRGRGKVRAAAAAVAIRARTSPEDPAGDLEVASGPSSRRSRVSRMETSFGMPRCAV